MDMPKAGEAIDRSVFRAAWNWLVAFAEALDFDPSELQDRRLRMLESEVTNLRGQVAKMRDRI